MANRTRKRHKTIQLGRDQLIFRFPNVHEDAELTIEFQRTLRIPDDNREYPLPPGLGKFPLYRVDDYPDNLPGILGKNMAGVFLPMYQTEAMWINFRADYPMAVKIAAGKINAVTGEAWTDELTNTPQDYLVVPGQPWLDGFCVEKGLIRQFVAMPLGEGYTAEEQLTGGGGARRASDCSLSHASVNIRGATKGADAVSKRCCLRGEATSRDGVGTGWSDASGDIRGRIRLQCVGALNPVALLSAYRQQCSAPSSNGLPSRRAGRGQHRITQPRGCRGSIITKMTGQL